MQGSKPSDLPDDVFNRCLQAAMESQEQKLDLSETERNNLMQAMKKPEFTSLMKEYMDEISDPKHRAEQEAYIRQLEADNKVPQNMQLVYPTAGFCVKLRRKEKDEQGEYQDAGKLFINVCSAKEVEEAKAKRQAGGAQWSLPYSLGPMRHENDKAGVQQPTFDFCLNDKTAKKASMEPNFQKMVIDTAVEAVEKRVVEVLKGSIKLDRPTARVLRGVNCMGGKPAIMQFPKNGSKNKTGSGPQAATTTKSKPTPKQAPVAPPKPANEPKYTVVHRGMIDLADFVGSTGASNHVSKRPKELVVRIQLPKIKSAKYLDIETSENTFKLTTTDKSVADYELDLPLPYPVFEEKGKAKFDKTARTLEIVLPVRPPPVSETNVANTLQSQAPAPRLIQEMSPSERTTLTTDSNQEESAEERKESTDAVEKAPEKNVRTTERKEESEQESQSTAQASASDIAKSITEESDLEAILRAAKEAAKLPFPKAEDNATPAPAELSSSDQANRAEQSTMKEKTPRSETVVGDFDENSDFIACDRFSGARCGFVFKLGNQGLGYYKDAAKETPKDKTMSSADLNADQREREEASDEHITRAKTQRQPRRLELRSKEMFELD